MKASFAAQQTNASILEAFVVALEQATYWLVDPHHQTEIEFLGLDGTQRLDALLEVKGASRPLCLAIEITRKGYPRDIKNALWQLDEYCRSEAATQREMAGQEILRMVIGSHLSPGARDALRARNVAYFDTSNGSLYIRHGTVIVNIERPSEPMPRSQPTSVFTGAREQVVHALLHARGDWVTGRDLAAQARTSNFTVSQTLRELKGMGWLVEKGGGRSAGSRLGAPGQLLDAWAAAWKARATTATRWFVYSPNQDRLVTDITSKLSDLGMNEWAITGAAAGNDMTPLLTAVDVLDVNVPQGMSELVGNSMGAKRVDKGANVVLHERSGAAHLFRGKGFFSDAPVASPWIIYLDLIKDDRGRHKELAAHLRSTILEV